MDKVHNAQLALLVTEEIRFQSEKDRKIKEAGDDEEAIAQIHYEADSFAKRKKELHSKIFDPEVRKGDAMAVGIVNIG